MIDLRLKFSKPAPDSVKGWENESLPLGNGYFGVSVFGGVEKERLQVCDPTLFSKGKDTYYRSMNSLAELFFDFPHSEITDYERGLDLNTAKAYVKYICDGIEYKREYFTSYPSRMLVMKFTASKKGALNFIAKPEIPYISEYHQFEGDGGGKSGNVRLENESIILNGKENWFNIHFESQLRVLHNSGETIYNNDSIVIKNSDEVVFIFTGRTNHQLSPEMFLEENDALRLKESDPHNLVEDIFANCPDSYEQIEKEHLADYQSLFLREKIELCDCYGIGLNTYELLEKAKTEFVPYLEILYFQYARYMIIASSRKGGVPASLQGVWNVYKQAPWGSGIWHNVNVQMNYWLSFAGNLPETFVPYVDYYNAYLPQAKKYADKFVKENTPENYVKDGENGFVVGTEATPYHISMLARSFSGPGNVGFTSQLFWSYYDYTRDEEILKNVTFPVLEQASKFLTKSVKKYGDLYLANFSASPEQNCVMRSGAYFGSPYNTVGCAYDQQMILDNGENFIKSAELLGIDNENVKIQKEQLDKYNPVEIGWSGQIKEYGEENFYGEIGEYCHRHISHLVGLYPGNLINSETPAWMDAARYTLNERGDNSTGWALAHRMCAWSRVGDGNRVHKLFKTLLNEKTNYNLWDMHPPFQIDGNFGASAAIAEMLVQSHEEYIRLLPALPDCWQKGKCTGFAARGGFDVDISWEDGSATEIVVTSNKGSILKIKHYGISEALVECDDEKVAFDIQNADKISFNTVKGKKYRIYNLKKCENVSMPTDLKVDRDTLKIAWDYKCCNAKFNVYRVCNSNPCYDIVATNIAECSFVDDIDFAQYDVVRYKVTAVVDGVESEGVVETINHATKLQVDRYKNSLFSKMPPENPKTSNQLMIPAE